MDLTIRGNDVEITDQLRQFADRRVEGFDRLLDRVVDAKLELRRVHHRTTAGDIAAQITIQTGRTSSAPKSATATPSAPSIAPSTKSNARPADITKRTDRYGPRSGALDDIPAPIDTTSDDDDPESVASLVRIKRFTVKPMDPEEAIEHMELLGHDFYLFHNAEEAQINVVYRRQDGTYGLLAPERS